MIDEELNPLNDIHFHRASAHGAERKWLCGFPLGQATGVRTQISCPDCLMILESEENKPSGNTEAVQMQPADMRAQE